MKTIYLCEGKGEQGKSHCVMAATSIVAGEDFTDEPVCVCPTITAALIHVNDSCPNDEIRNRLLGHLPWLIIGTRGELEHQVTRASLFAVYAAAAADAAACAAANAATRDAAAAAANAAANAAAAARAAAADVRDAANAAACAAANATAANAGNAADAAACAAANAAAATAAARAVVADADADADAATAWELSMKQFIDFIETKIIPVYSAMPIEKDLTIAGLITTISDC